MTDMMQDLAVTPRARLEVTQNELWLLSYYRESELAGSLLMGRLAQQTDDDELRVRFTEHCAEEAQHAWAWTEAILAVGGQPLRVSETYQSRYHDAVGNPSSLLDVLALTQVFERRVVRHFRAHLSWPGTHPVVAATLKRLIAEEAGHIGWVKRRLDAIAAVHGQAVVDDALDRFRKVDDAIYEELSKYADCFEQVASAKERASSSIEQRLRRVAADSLGREPEAIAADVPLSELGVDSLDLVVLMMAVEEEFRTEFTKEEQKAMRTLGDVRRCVEARGGR
jgi:acyl carrier protein